MSIKEFSKFLKHKKNEGVSILPLLDNYEVQSFKPISLIPERKNVSIVEESSFFTKNIPINSTVSGFSYFLDGIERKVIFNDNSRFLPLIYGYVAAVIMKRTDKKMHSVNLEEVSDKIYLPLKVCGDEPDNYFDMSDFANFKFEIKNIGTKNENVYPLFPKEFESKAHSEVQDTRVKLERSLAVKWISQNNNDGWLFIDGRLESKNNELISSSKIAGIIKSHHVYYFDYADQARIFALKKGERSCVFQPEGENIFSWYLRLHQKSSTAAMDFGIIRVEIPSRKELLSQVDLISSWILLETNPIAFPASRWDRMIYPIKYCEDYLKSKAPSYTLIESLI